MLNERRITVKNYEPDEPINLPQNHTELYEFLSFLKIMQNIDVLLLQLSHGLMMAWKCCTSLGIYIGNVHIGSRRRRSVYAYYK